MTIMDVSPGATATPNPDVGKIPIRDQAPSIEPEDSAIVKKEEQDDSTVDPGLAIFEDVDNVEDEEEEETELVDDNHVGFIDYNGVNCWVCPGFRIPQIPDVQVVRRPLKDLCDAIKTNDIVLDPEYQRDVVWDDMRAEGLIVSLLMGYLPPPIIFNVKLKIFETPNGKVQKHIRTCVDGKQRLTSILRFMRGEIGFLDSKHKKWYYDVPSNTNDTNANGDANDDEPHVTHAILPKDVKKFFMSRFFICYEYNELSQSTEEEMFQLVQRGIALTPAEKMRAMSTEWAKFARQYEEDYSMVMGLSKQSRGSGFRLTLTMFSMIQEVMADRKNPASIPALQASPQCLTRMLEEKDPINPALKLRMKAIFDKYEQLIKMTSTKLTTRKWTINPNSVFHATPEFLKGDGFDHARTFSPLELISTGIFISYHMDKRTDEELLEDLKQLRVYLRVKHKDLRVNAQCWATVWRFMMDVGRSQDDDIQDSITVNGATKRNRKDRAKTIYGVTKKAGIKDVSAMPKKAKPSSSKTSNSRASKSSALGRSGAGKTIGTNGAGSGTKVRTTKTSIRAGRGDLASGTAKRKRRAGAEDDNSDGSLSSAPSSDDEDPIVNRRSKRAADEDVAFPNLDMASKKAKQ